MTLWWVKVSPENAQLKLDFTAGNLFLLTPDEIYQQSESLIAVLKEDRRLERKPAGTHPSVLGQYFSMWANTTPSGGLTVLGIEDDGRISGCKSLGHKRLNEREKASRVYCPESRTDSRRVKVKNSNDEDDFLVLFLTRYREDRVVRDVSGNAYIRVGDEKHKLAMDELYELQRDKGEIDFEQESVNLAYPDDFHTELVREFCKKITESFKLSEPHEETEILEIRHLGRRKNGVFIPNVACALLFSKDPCSKFPGCKIRFLRFEGEVEKTGEEYNVIKDMTIEGAIPYIIQRARGIVDSQLREFSRLGPDGKFYTAPEYPIEAWYEAIVNASVHRSYGLKNMNVFIKMFDDRLVVESPGGFPPFVTPDTIYYGSHPRNPHLMNAMFFLDFVKCHAEGTKRMRDSMGKMNLPDPEFSQKEVASGYMSVRVTLRNNKKQRRVWVDAEATRVLPDSIAKVLSQDEIRIVNFAAEHGSINVSEAHRLLPHIRTWHSIKRLLMKMVQRDILEYKHRRSVARDAKARFTLHNSTAKAINGIDQEKKE